MLIRFFPDFAGHVETIGVRRPNYGTVGRVVPILVNSFRTTVPQSIIRHYDGEFSPFGLFVLLLCNRDSCDNSSSRQVLTSIGSIFFISHI